MMSRAAQTHLAGRVFETPDLDKEYFFKLCHVLFEWALLFFTCSYFTNILFRFKGAILKGPSK